MHAPCVAISECRLIVQFFPNSPAKVMIFALFLRIQEQAQRTASWHTYSQHLNLLSAKGTSVVAWLVLEKHPLYSPDDATEEASEGLHQRSRAGRCSQGYRALTLPLQVRTSGRQEDAGRHRHRDGWARPWSQVACALGHRRHHHNDAALIAGPLSCRHSFTHGAAAATGRYIARHSVLGSAGDFGPNHSYHDTPSCLVWCHALHRPCNTEIHACGCDRLLLGTPAPLSSSSFPALIAHCIITCYNADCAVACLQRHSCPVVRAACATCAVYIACAAWAADDLANPGLCQFPVPRGDGSPRRPRIHCHTWREVGTTPRTSYE